MDPLPSASTPRNFSPGRPPRSSICPGPSPASGPGTPSSTFPGPRYRLARLCNPTGPDVVSSFIVLPPLDHSLPPPPGPLPPPIYYFFPPDPDSAPVPDHIASTVSLPPLDLSFPQPGGPPTPSFRLPPLPYRPVPLPQQNPSIPVQFYFGHAIPADAKQIGHFAHVHQLQLRRTYFDTLLHHVLLQSPQWVQNQVRAYRPAWLLPSTVILKGQKPGWEEEFDHEKETYERLKSLQGDIIPVYYGEATYKGRRALLLSDVGGTRLRDPTGPDVSEDDIRRMLEHSLRRMIELEAVHDDLKLDNFHLVGEGPDKVVVLDMESVEFRRPDNADHTCKMMVDDLTSMYVTYREYVNMANSGG